MTKNQVIRAWKDKAYRASLSEAQRASLPAHPAGPVELSAREIASVAGGARPAAIVTKGCCYL